MRKGTFLSVLAVTLFIIASPQDASAQPGCISKCETCIFQGDIGHSLVAGSQKIGANHGCVSNPNCNVHSNCGPLIPERDEMLRTRKLLRFAALVELRDAFPDAIHLNWDRRMAQFMDCDGLVVAAIPLPDDYIQRHMAITATEE